VYTLEEPGQVRHAYAIEPAVEKRAKREYAAALLANGDDDLADPELTDDWGVPAIRVTYQDHPDDVKHANWLVQRAVEIMDAAGATQVVPGEVGEANGGVHLLGTCRMGNDPKTSVVDADHRAHDVPNLFVCDGSSFVTSGRGQPTCTIQALAFRAGERISSLARRGGI